MNGDDNGELPEAWTAATIPDVCELNPAKPKPDQYAADLPVTFVPMPAVDADSGKIANPSVRPFGEVRKGFTSFRDNDVILAKITPCMENGKAAVARGLTNRLGFGSTEFHVLRSNGSILPEYLFYFVRQESFRKAAEAEMTGSVGQKRVPSEYLESVELPVPPLAEQRRIVAAVETVLAKVNAARERLNRVPAILKRFRQAVLAAACSGRLTADWREQSTECHSAAAQLDQCAQATEVERQGRRKRRGTEGLAEVELPDNLPASWTIKTVRELEDCGALVEFQDGNHGELYPRAADFGEEGVKFLTATQVFDNRVLLEQAPRLSSSKAAKLRIGFARSRDVLLTHNATVGRVAILPPTTERVILGTSVTYYRFRPEYVLPEFIAFEMQGSLWQRQLAAVMEQTTRNQVSITKQIEFSLPIPPVAEQREIVRRVGALFALADRIEDRLIDARRMADQLTQAVLAKAFRGELVPTEAELARREKRSYEPAADLLARIRTERENMTDEPGKRKAGRPARRG